jgi:bifunctional non-homologous end joining protein LigD
VEDNKINLSHLEKVLWPAAAGHPVFSKRDLLLYLMRVAPYILPHLKDRPLTMSRYPDGIYGEHFYQKHWGYSVPDFVEKVNVSEEKGAASQYLVCNNLSTLLWLGQAANLEFHTWFSRTGAKPDMAEDKTGPDSWLDYPDFLIFDLDPYLYSGEELSGAEPELNRQGFARTCEAALWLKEALDGLSLRAFVKTSGKTGLHIYAPIKRNMSYKAVRSAAETIGKYLLQRHPREITMDWPTEKRKGKVFVDWGQNARGKTLASIYSPRPVPEAAVSTPLRWEELGKVYPADFTLTTLPGRLKETGDLWADMMAARKDLGEAV